MHALPLRFSVEAGVYGLPELEIAIRKQPEDRLHRDVQVITNWLGQQVRSTAHGRVGVISAKHPGTVVRATKSCASGIF